LVPADPVIVSPGETSHVTIALDIAARAEEIVVKTVSAVGGPSVDPDHCRLVAANGRIVKGKWGFTDRIAFDRLDYEPHTLVVDDPRYATVRVEGLQPSDGVLEIPVKGLCAFRLRVLDASDGSPIRNYSLSLSFVGLPRSQGVLPVESRPGSVESYGDIPAEEFDLWIEAPGFQTTSEPVTTLTAGETREIQVRLQREGPRDEAAVRGRVFETDGVTPALGVLVKACSPEGALTDEPFRGLGSWVTTDAQGAFAIPGIDVSSFVAGNALCGVRRAIP
jgi:hypothetical protein